MSFEAKRPQEIKYFYSIYFRCCLFKSRVSTIDSLHTSILQQDLELLTGKQEETYWLQSLVMQTHVG